MQCRHFAILNLQYIFHEQSFLPLEYQLVHQHNHPFHSWNKRSKLIRFSIQVKRMVLINNRYRINLKKKTGNFHRSVKIKGFSQWTKIQFLTSSQSCALRRSCSPSRTPVALHPAFTKDEPAIQWAAVIYIINCCIDIL